MKFMSIFGAGAIILAAPVAAIWVRENEEKQLLMKINQQLDSQTVQLREIDRKVEDIKTGLVVVRDFVDGIHAIFDDEEGGD